MKKLFLLFLLIPLISLNAQKIGELAPDTNRIDFPSNSWGVNLAFGEGGFGLGSFWKKELSKNLYGFIDFSISESKDDKEFDYVDYYGMVFTRNKKNRVFALPINLGIQFRLFPEGLTDNLRPYLSFAVGPTFVVTNPYEKEFFEAIGYSTMKVALGGYAAFGANFGISKTTLIGITIKYSYAHLFSEGVENLYGRFRNDLGALSISLDIGLQY
ncbi:MAG: hypothetical protein C0412_08205 [Flavobacterium sp.]|nr:hypothetical protein [Flavobacterium sp.]